MNPVFSNLSNANGEISMYDAFAKVPDRKDKRAL